jgi:hypothetical protein
MPENRLLTHGFPHQAAWEIDFVSASRLTILGVCAFLLLAPLVQANWAQFREPDGKKVAEGKSTPTDWSEERNLRW